VANSPENAQHWLPSKWSRYHRAKSSCLFPNLTGSEGGQRLRHGKLRSPLSTIMKVMNLNVECYSGRKADERPVRFYLDGTLYRVEEVLDQWYDPEHIFYKVRANNGNFYILRQETSTPNAEWDLILFRQNVS
jgi:hypothetical protein